MAETGITTSSADQWDDGNEPNVARHGLVPPHDDASAIRYAEIQAT